MATDRKGQGGEFCCAIGCSSARLKKSCAYKAFFQFPRERERCMKWVQNTRREDLLGKQPDELKKAGVKLCSDHFEDSQFTVPTERRRLNWNAVPTLFAVPNPPPAVTSKRKPPKERTSDVPSQKKSKLPVLEEESCEPATPTPSSLFPSSTSPGKQGCTVSDETVALKNIHGATTVKLEPSDEFDSEVGCDTEETLGASMALQQSLDHTAETESDEELLQLPVHFEQPASPKSKTISGSGPDRICDGTQTSGHVMLGSKKLCTASSDGVLKDDEKTCSDCEEDTRVDPASKCSSVSGSQKTANVKQKQTGTWSDAFGRRYACDQCSSAFTSPSHLKIHKRVHTGEKPFTCRECSAAFSDSSSFKRHMRIHTGDRPYVCKECGDTFTQSSSLNTHRRLHTGVRPYVCDVCNMAFYSSSHLQKHKEMHLDERPRPYVCVECGAAFCKSSNLKRHTYVHTRQRNYACNKCREAFTTSGDLKRHNRVHSGEKPFVCSNCGAAFSQSSHLKKHTQKHALKSLTDKHTQTMVSQGGKKKKTD